jgi:hypothetical protein
MSLPDQNKNKSPFSPLYNPEYIPEKLNVQDFISVQEVVEVVNEDKTTEAIPGAGKAVSSNGLPIPLTPKEAEQALIEIRNTKTNLKIIKEKIKTTRQQIDKEIATGLSARNKSELAFKLNIKGKPMLRRAVRQVFGIDTDTITYSMYKELLQMRQTLEIEDADGYVRGYKDAP